MIDWFHFYFASFNYLFKSAKNGLSFRQPFLNNSIYFYCCSPSYANRLIRILIDFDN